MKKTLALLAVTGALVLVPAAVNAQERLRDGLLGAGAGALVGGPVGAVVGGAIGATSGPGISDGLGLSRHRHYRHRRYAHRHHHGYRHEAERHHGRDI